MSEAGRKALQRCLEKIDQMSDDELREIFEEAHKKAKRYEEDLDKFNEGLEND